MTHTDWEGCLTYLESQGYVVRPPSPDLRENIQSVCAADFVVVLPGWEFHNASNVETSVARALKMPVLACRTLLPVFLA